tara:strand:+ start:62 stop:496 length:435 start_codon:yes stop_codon:yes gene_type:complete
MDKYELLRNVNFNDIGNFCLNGRNTTGKIVKIYNSNTFSVIFALNKVIFKFNCKLRNTDINNCNPQKILNYITDDYNKQDNFNNILKNNKKLLQVKCYEFDQEGYLLIDLIDSASKLNIKDVLIEQNILKCAVTDKYFNFKKLD